MDYGLPSALAGDKKGWGGYRLPERSFCHICIVVQSCRGRRPNSLVSPQKRYSPDTIESGVNPPCPGVNPRLQAGFRIGPVQRARCDAIDARWIATATPGIVWHAGGLKPGPERSSRRRRRLGTMRQPMRRRWAERCHVPAVGKALHCAADRGGAMERCTGRTDQQAR